MKRFLSISLRVLLYALIAVMLLVTSLSLISRAQGADIPRVLGFGQVVVITGSMSPAVEAGDLLIIREQAQYQAGDIITFADRNSLVTHRLIDFVDGKAITKGDANNAQDAPLDPNNIRGKMVLRVPQAGRLVLFMRSSQGMLLLVGALLIILFIEIVFKKNHRAK